MDNRVKFYSWLIGLLARKHFTFEEIANEWRDANANQDEDELDKRTFHRYRENIQSQFGITVECDKSDGYRYYLKRDPIANDDVTEWMLSSLRLASLGDMLKFHNKVMLDTPPYNTEYLDDILAAIDKQYLLKFKYVSGFGAESDIVLQPAFVRYFKQRWYVVGVKKQRSASEGKANSNDLEMTDKNNNIDDKIVRGYGEQALRNEAQAILDQIPYLDDNFEKAVAMMYQCQGKIIVTGVGKSGHVGAKIAATLASTGTPAFYINPLDIYHGDLGVMTDKDVVLALSNSGQTDELLRFIPMVLHMNIPIISITGNPDSLLAKYSNHHITVKVKKEACPLNLAPTSSTTAALAMGDALAIALMQVRHFKPRDFAQFHPGGELGKRLLTTAEDVMRSDDMPIIPKEMHLGEAIIHVSKGKLGLGISLDEDNHVIGLITDGDIRRAMEKWQAEFFNKTVSDIMTTTPKMVTPKTKISEIQRIMHKYKVHTVLVVDKDNHLKGIVDHYACMV